MKSFYFGKIAYYRIRLPVIFSFEIFSKLVKLSIMERNELSPIQQEILTALEALGERARYSESILVKKIREKTGLDGKKKAGIGLADLEKAIEFQEEKGTAFYSVIMNSANDILIEKNTESHPLSGEARTRRLKSEKSMGIITSRDLNVNKKSGEKQKILKRSDRKKMNVNKNFEDFQDD